MEVVKVEGVVYFSGAVPAGFPSPAMDYLEDRIDLNKLLVKHPLSTFMIDCAGTSMVDAFIPPKCRLIVDRSITAKNGDIVFAVVDGEFTVKYLKKDEDKCWLYPANERMKPIEISAGQQLQIWGVVTHIITDTADLRTCTH